MSQRKRDYSESHARSGIKEALPVIECWENQYPGYGIELVFPEFTSVCPKTGLPDFGTLTIRYQPERWVLETKSLKLYLNAFRDLGIFTENVVNRVLASVVSCAKPRWAEVEGRFSARGGIEARITARHGRNKSNAHLLG
ncbi:MAG: NADPH-dependent 7-cyano-7-deazaguanine reductase QueF [Elusimicrobia bacterium]|nr:NADPH-dependent 7-cyano-7-deazaguanine reductase QueF [Elusimicrobiota bacterium]